ncbi:MAG TPA: ribose 5-phosphate isomerase B [bacterium]|nr:ribose 5-phosphate isomerase B [bacterium]
MEPVAIASDHAGFSMKRVLCEHLTKSGYEVMDLGADSSAEVDYPEYAEKLCKAIVQGEVKRGILLCGIGVCMSIAANKFKGIYAALCTNEFMARMSRAHIDSNVLCLGAGVISDEVAKAIVDVWLTTDFEGGKYSRRLDRIKKIENSLI